MNGNYLVILVSVIVILPLALMRQLGEFGGARALEGCMGGDLRSHIPPPQLCRLPRLLQWLLSQLHGVLPNCSELPSTLVEGGGQVLLGSLGQKAAPPVLI